MNPLHPVIFPPGAVLIEEGATLRDAFAMAALGVMCASNVNETGTFGTTAGRATVAQVCWLMADAMLDARAAPVEPATEQPEPTP